MEKKSTGKTVLIVILLLAVIGLGGYIVYDKILVKESTDTEETTKTGNKEETNIENYIGKLQFDSSKIVSNNKEYKYSISAYSTGTDITLDENNKVKLNISWDVYADDSMPKKTGNDEYTIDFSKKVVDVYKGTIGNDVGGDLALFLMEDGTIEYMPLFIALQKNEIKSFGKVEGLNNIVKFYNGHAWVEGAGGYITIFAQDNDGKIYNLFDYIKF